MSKIEDVNVKKMTPIHDERGYLYEILRSDWPVFKKFGQLYLTTTYKDAIKAWHLHEVQTDNICCVHGMIKLVVLDIRRGSLYFGCHQEFFIGENNPCLITIPPGIAHGWKCYNSDMAIVINCPTELYNYSKADEIRFKPDHKFRITDEDFYQYDWSRKDG